MIPITWQEDVMVVAYRSVQLFGGRPSGYRFQFITDEWRKKNNIVGWMRTPHDKSQYQHLGMECTDLLRH